MQIEVLMPKQAGCVHSRLPVSLALESGSQHLSTSAAEFQVAATAFAGLCMCPAPHFAFGIVLLPSADVTKLQSRRPQANSVRCDGKACYYMSKPSGYISSSLGFKMMLRSLVQISGPADGLCTPGSKP